MKHPHFLYHREPDEQVLQCTIPGCDGLRWEDTEVCSRCAEEIEALNRWAARKAARKESHYYARRAARLGENLRHSAYAAAVIALMAWILFEFRGFISDCCELWFGSKQW
jgi:hypothetical protein